MSAVSPNELKQEYYGYNLTKNVVTFARLKIVENYLEISSPKIDSNYKTQEMSDLKLRLIKSMFAKLKDARHGKE